MRQTVAVLSIKIFLIIALLITPFFAEAQYKFPDFKKVQFGKGLTFITKDSTFKITFSGRIQTLLSVSYDVKKATTTSQFSIRRARIRFDGYIFSPRLSYKIQLGLSNTDIGINNEDGLGDDASRIVRDAVIRWNFFKSYVIGIGQTKLPGNRERVNSSANLQFVDRSILNARFNIDRDMGIFLEAKYKFGNFIISPSASITQGEGRNIVANNFGGLCYTGHIDFLPLGEFTGNNDYTGGDLEREEKPKLAIGLTANYNDRAIRQVGQTGAFVKDSTGAYIENSLSSYMADMIFKYQGFSFHSEFVYTNSSKLVEGVDRKFHTGYAFNVQTGYLFKKNYELAARFSMTRKDNDFSNVKNENEYTLAFSKYIVKHALKIQTDFSYTHAPTVLEGVFRARLQIQVQF